MATKPEETKKETEALGVQRLETLKVGDWIITRTNERIWEYTNQGKGSFKKLELTFFPPKLIFKIINLQDTPISTINALFRTDINAKFDITVHYSSEGSTSFRLNRPDQLENVLTRLENIEKLPPEIKSHMLNPSKEQARLLFLSMPAQAAAAGMVAGMASSDAISRTRSSPPRLTGGS